MSSPVLRIGSRDSVLALTQTHLVADALKHAWPDLQVEIHTFKTQGDLILDTALSKIGDKGLFVKELEAALLQNQIDLAVHSLKDMPGELPPGLGLVSAMEREAPGDVLLSLRHEQFKDLPSGAVIGTSSLRRVAQLTRLRPDLKYQTIRGNLQTRYRKLEAGQYDALVLAAAGVKRLGWQDRISDWFDPWDSCVPAVAQGILGLEFREDDAQTSAWLTPIQIPTVEVARIAERAFLTRLGGGCQLPLGAYCRLVNVENDLYEMKAVVLSTDGKQLVEATHSFLSDQAASIGAMLAEAVLSQGAKQILESVKHGA